MPILVPKERHTWFLVLFSLQFSLWLGFTCIAVDFKGSIFSDATTVLRAMGPAVLVTTATTIVIVEVGFMLAEQFLKKREERGEQNRQRLWEDWNRKREGFEAENPGKRFPEPPPSLSTNGHK